MPLPSGTAWSTASVYKPVADSPRHDIVMGGFSTDHAAKRDAAAMAPCPADEAVGKRKAERERNFE